MILSDTPKIQAFNIDCMEFMKDKPDNYYDLAIVDPPYGIGAGTMTMGSGKHIFKNGDWDSATPNRHYFEELFRVSSNQIVWGGNYFTEYLGISRHWLMWDKLNPNLSFAEGELAWVRNGDNLRIFKKYSAQVEYGGKIHPTQKPTDLYRWILNRYAKEGDKILDTHGGSFSSAIACHMEGFDLDICELDEDYFNDAVKRFKLNTIQEKLF